MSKVLFFDVDGTLTNFGEGIYTLSDDLLLKLKAIKSEGNYLFIATGRPYAFVNEYLLSLDFDGFVMANGAHIMINDMTVFERAIDKNIIERVVHFLDQNNIQYIIQDTRYGYIKASFTELIEFYKTAAIKENHLIFEFDESIYTNVVKMEVQLPKELKEEFAMIIENDLNYDYNDSLGFMEIYSKEVTKAEGVKKTLQHFDLGIENSYAFGDGHNDIEMMKTVGLGVAMGNGVAELKEIADYITDDFMNNGLLKALDEFF